MTLVHKAHNSQLNPSSSWLIEHLPGLTSQDCQKLQGHGIKTTGQLLQQAHTPSGSAALAAHLAVPPKYVMKWAAMADLASIPAVGCQYCGLLLHSGIASSQHLAQIPLGQLHQRILRFQVATLQRRDLCPDLGTLTTWITQAQKLTQKPRVFTQTQKVPQPSVRAQQE
jgi:Domain of unknown function (DUF4332)